MIHELDGCALKIQRALFHMERLNEAIKGFRKPETHGLIREEDPQTGEGVWYLDIPNPPPPTWSPLIGDILHNLHSTLDHLAWRLAVRRNYGHDLPAESRATFPIFKKRSRFWRKRTDNGKWTGLSGASSLLRFPGDARKLVLAVQPYKDGDRSPDHPLWILHALSNEDKHKTLHVIQAALVDSALEIDELQDVRIDHFTPKTGPIRGRTEIGRIGVTQIGPNPICELKPGFAIAEAFSGGPSMVENLYIGEVLGGIGNYISDEVFARFGPYFGIEDWPRWFKDFVRRRKDEYPL